MLPRIADVTRVELDAKCAIINRFDQARSEETVNLDRRADDLGRDLIEREFQISVTLSLRGFFHEFC
jgi:hypothetical protein